MIARGRGWAYVGAVLGGAVSVAANVAHSYVPPAGAAAGWAPQPGAVAGAVFWPVALFVAIEILARVAWPSGARWVLLRYLGLLPVAAVAAVVSYRHLSGLLAFYGEDPLTVAVGPLAVDGLMVVASAALMATARTAPAVEVDQAPAVEVDQAVAEPEPVAAPAEPVTEPVRPVRVSPRSLTAAERVKAVHDRHPDATHERVAQLASVSVSTVKRHRPAVVSTGSPSGAPPAQTAVPERVNGAPVVTVRALD